MTSNIMLSPINLQETLPRVMASVAQYDTLFALLRARARKRGGFPWKLYRALRILAKPNRPYFVGQTRAGVHFVGDFRDVHSVHLMTLQDAVDPVIGLLERRMANTRASYLDIGANAGVIASHVARTFRHGQEVLAFEPVATTNERAAATFALNGLNDVRLFRVGIGAENGELSLFATTSDSGIATAHPSRKWSGISWNETIVPSRTLDSLRSDGILKTVGVMKIDVEGHELAVLRGALSLLASDRPSVVFEYNFEIAPDVGWEPQDAADILQQAAPYRQKVLRNDGSTSSFPPAFAVSGFVNICCDAGL